MEKRAPASNRNIFENGGSHTFFNQASEPMFYNALKKHFGSLVNYHPTLESDFDSAVQMKRLLREDDIVTGKPWIN